MANSLDVRIVQDGRRNAIVRLIGLVDTVDMVVTPAITLAQFTNNDGAPNVFNGLRFVEADFSVANDLTVLLEWNGNTKQPMANLGASSNLDARRHGGYGPDRKASGYDGNINLYTRGFVPGRVYGFTVLLRMTKMYGT